MKTYGVSHVPDVMSLDLQQLFHREQGGDVPDQMVSRKATYEALVRYIQYFDRGASCARNGH